MSSSSSSRKGGSRKHGSHSKSKGPQTPERFGEWSEWQHDARGSEYPDYRYKLAPDGQYVYEYYSQNTVSSDASGQQYGDTKYTHSCSTQETPKPQPGSNSNGESVGYTVASPYGSSYGGYTSSTWYTNSSSTQETPKPQPGTNPNGESVGNTIAAPYGNYYGGNASSAPSSSSSMSTLTSNFSSMSSISSAPSPSSSATSISIPEVRVVAWTLDTPNPAKPAKPKQSSSSVSNAQAPLAASFNENVVNNPDTRRQVDAQNLGPSGNRTAICQLTIMYETYSGHKKSIGATGFVINLNTIVTAGHAVYHLGDPNDRVHHAKSIKVVLGHDGQGTPSSRLRRHGRFVAVGRDYYDSEDSSGNDIACITLDRPFNSDQVMPLRLKTIPTYSGENVTVRIAGYPGDLNRNTMEGMKLMYESEVYGPIAFDSRKRFQYKIDTNAGESGSPILISSDSNYYGELAIGVHTTGDSEKNQLNHGVDIHKDGNAVPAFLKALRSQAGAQEPDTERVPIQSSSGMARDLSFIRVKNYSW